MRFGLDLPCFSRAIEPLLPFSKHLARFSAHSSQQALAQALAQVLVHSRGAAGSEGQQGQVFQYQIGIKKTDLRLDLKALFKQCDSKMYSFPKVTQIFNFRHPPN